MRVQSAFLGLLALASGLAGVDASALKTPKGFVTTKGTKFQLDGKDFYFAGTNAYYLPFGNNQTDVELGMKAATKAGLKVFRTWGFYDKNATYDPLGLPKYGGGGGPSEVYFQSWDKGNPTINYGPTGLQAFDKVVKAAEKTGIKLVVALTNNWADFGGMDVYTINLGGKYHDDFYHVPDIVNAYKNYITVFINRYKDSPAIMAWQLANEPRCGADGVRNLPRSADCDHKRMAAWVQDISAYIKKLDPYHLVSTGSEGEFNFPNRTDDWAYSSSDGGDFYGELSLPNVDYGTFHLYPDWWSRTRAWGTQWVKDHAAAQYSVGKPVVFEEYGWLSPEKRLEYLGKNTTESRTLAVGEWQRTAVDLKLAGTMYWQFGFSGYSYGRNNDDGFTIFLDNKPEADVLVVKHAKDMNALNKKK